MEEKRDIIASNILYLRKLNNMSQSQLAEKMNFSDKAISKWERGESMPDVDSLFELSKIFNVSVDFFFYNDSKNNYKYIKNSKLELVNKIILLSLIWLSIFTIALSIFLFANIRNMPSKNDIWVAFVWAVPLCLAFTISFMKRNHLYLGLTITISLFVWTLLSSIYLTTVVCNEPMWMIFLIGVPLQTATILIYFFRKNKHHYI